MKNGLVPYPHVAVKNQRNTLTVEVATEEEGSQPQTGSPAWRTSARKKSPTAAACENQQGLSPGETEECCRPKHHLKRHEHKFTCSQTITPNFREETVAQKVPETYGEELNYLASGQGPEGQLSPALKCQRALLLLC